MSDSIYKDGLVQLHDTGVVERMRTVSGDPSSRLPSSIDIASPTTPVFDIARPAEKSFIIYEPQITSAAPSIDVPFASAAQLAALNDATSWTLQQCVWEENYNGTTWDGWLELLANCSWGNGQLFTMPLMAYFATLAGPMRRVQIIRDSAINHMVFNKTFGIDQTGTKDERFTGIFVKGLTWRINRTAGAGTPNSENIVANFLLTY